MTKHNKRSIRWPTVKALIVVAFASPLLLLLNEQNLTRPVLSQAPTRSIEQMEVGKDCKQCHGAVVESFALQAHGKAAKFLTDSRAASCQVCHTNSIEHAENSSRTKSGGDPGNPSKQTAAKANSTCLQCHSQDKHTFAWAGGEHDKNNVSCLSCHSQHHSKSEENLLASFTTEETCLRCHTGVRKAMHQRSTHLFRTEHRNTKVGCTSCHNPHGGDGDKMMVAETVNNTCYGCHAEKRGPFLWEHAPVRENCMSCHSPHGSNNAKLLTARAHMSCQQCHIHMLPRHSTTAGRPLDIWSLNRGCVNCHSQIHGSNHPGGRTLTR